MGEQVRTGPPEILLRLSTRMGAVRNGLAQIGTSPHTVLDLVPPGAQPVELSALFADLRRVNEEAIERLARLASSADRTIALTAYALAYVAREYPQTDADSAARLRLGAEALTAAPPARDPAAIDPRFTSPARPR